MTNTATGAPVELLQPTQSINDVARHLSHLRRNGEPNRRVVHDLIKSGRLRPVDPTQPIHRWTVSVDELRRYIAHGPLTGSARADAAKAIADAAATRRTFAA